MDKMKVVEQLMWLAASLFLFVANIVSTYVLFYGRKP